MIVGSDMTPLLTGQVDAIAGWRTNTTALKVLGPDYIAMRMWDHGVRLYALPYYTTADFLNAKPEVLAGFLRAAGRGWAYAKANPEKAVDLLVQEYPNLVRADELAAAPIMMDVEFTERTKTYRLGQFRSGGLAGADRPARRAEAIPGRQAEARSGHHDENPRNDRKRPAEDRLRR